MSPLGVTSTVKVHAMPAMRADRAPQASLPRVGCVFSPVLPVTHTGDRTDVEI